MAREQYLRGVNVEELQASQQSPKPPMTFWQKVEKFWYNYRIAVILGAIVLVVAVTVGILIGTREKVDYSLVLVTKGIVNETTRGQLENDLAKYGEDLDGDGAVNVRIIPLAMTDSGDYVELATIFSGGTAVFFAMEPEYYEAQIASLETEDTHYFTELSDVTDVGLAENGRYWNWSGSDAYTVLSEGLPSELYFGVRLPIGTASGKENEEASAACTALLTRYIAEMGTTE